MELKVKQLNDAWFKKLEGMTAGLKPHLTVMQKMMGRMATAVGSGGTGILNISPDELKSMNIISNQLYAQVGKGAGLAAFSSLLTV